VGQGQVVPIINKAEKKAAKHEAQPEKAKKKLYT
jgi:hypothetical protein